VPSRRRLPGGHTVISNGDGSWVTDDERFNIESDLIETECGGLNSRSGYCPAHGYACSGETAYLAWTVWDTDKGDHIDGNPFPYYSFGEALERLKGEYT